MSHKLVRGRELIVPVHFLAKTEEIKDQVQSKGYYFQMRVVEPRTMGFTNQTGYRNSNKTQVFYIYSTTYVQSLKSGVN